MPFYAHIKQAGEGCDYSIKCGEMFFEVRGASSMEDAKARVLDTYGSRHYLDPNGDGRLASISIFESAGPVEIDLQAVLNLLLEDERDAAAREKEAADRANYDRLKKKYGAP